MSGKLIFYFSIHCLLLTWLVSCSAVISNSYDSSLKSDVYHFSAPPIPWKDIEPDHSDHAFINQSTASLIMIHSLCKKYQKSSLNSLSSNIFNGIKDLKIIKTMDQKFASRAAKSTDVMGTMDGVRVLIRVLTFKKNRCTYDFALISAEKELPKKDIESYNQLLSSVRFKD